jgi:hypothetical protein
MTTLITITAAPVTTLGSDNYDYTGEDRILHNIMTNDYEVFYSGQNQGNADNKLLESVEEQSIFRIYYRKQPNTTFTYLGKTNVSSIIHERIVPNGTNTLPNERLQIRLVILAADVVNQQINTNFEGIGKYKKSVLEHSNFIINGKNLNIGFYKKN